jgi:hypothetical protein
VGNLFETVPAFIAALVSDASKKRR